jgi:hypothetical protein
MAQQSQQAIRNRDRVGWAARYIQIHREQALDAVANLGVPPVKAAGNGAGSGSDDELWFGDRFVGRRPMSSSD